VLFVTNQRQKNVKIGVKSKSVLYNNSTTFHNNAMTKLSIQLLGAFQVEHDGRPVNGFATDKARALLAYLAVERERPHRRESLSALLWPEQNDERARQSLRQALSHLKQALGGEDFLLISPQDIQLNPQASVWIDVSESAALARASQRHRHRSIECCLPCLRRQQNLLEIYAGDFLNGFPSQNSENFEEWVTLTRERLRQQAMSAHILLADLYELRGDQPTALEHAYAQISLEPWREEAHRQVMRILAQNGERSKALAQYHACRRVLANELGVAPTAETTALFETIQNGDLPPPKIVPHPPEPATSFIGRTREQSEIAELLADPTCRLVTLLGMGGVGKSSLAMQIARTHNGIYRDGVFFVPLIGVNDAPGAIAVAIGQPAPDAGTRLAELLRNKQILLVLDNFEHLVESSDGLTDVLAAAPGLQILVTSRERLRLREESVYMLEGLSFPQEGENDLPDPRVFDALALFETRAAQIDPRFRLTRNILPDVLEICRLVEGLPLAIELAASAVSDRSCAEVALALSQTFGTLLPALRNFPARHRSLRAVFEHTWNILSTQEQRQLVELSVFLGGFSAEAALIVTGTPTPKLADLAAKSLLRRDMDGRYALHESLRQFSVEKLEPAAAARTRHGAYYANLAAHCNGSTSANELDVIQKERANLRAAWEWSFSAHQSESIPGNLKNGQLSADLLTGLALLYTLRGPLSEGENLFREAILKLDGDKSQEELKNRLSIELARIYNAQTHHQQAIELAKSVTTSSVDREQQLQARALLVWGQALGAQGECEAARPILSQALTLARELGDKRVEADSLRELGNAANRLTEYDLAIPLYSQALAISRELGDKRGESATLNNWGSVEYDLGDLAAAQTHYQQSLTLYRELGNLLGEAKALNNLSNVSADQGDLAASLQYSQQAVHIHREMGNPRGQSAALNNLGATYYLLGQYDAARKNYQQSLVFYRESGNQQAEAETLANLSLLDCVLGHLVSGRENALKAIRLAEKTGDKVNLANALYYLGRNQLAAGNLDAAEIALQRALDLRHEIPHQGRQAEILAEIAWASQMRARNTQALELLGPVLKLLSDPLALNGSDDPFRIYMLTAQILAANGDARANVVRISGASLLRERAGKISDPAYRLSFETTHNYFSESEG
jgi:DNA-binding SARP family transcriptional activator/predicted ATPase